MTADHGRRQRVGTAGRWSTKRGCGSCATRRTSAWVAGATRGHESATPTSCASSTVTPGSIPDTLARLVAPLVDDRPVGLDARRCSLAGDRRRRPGGRPPSAARSRGHSTGPTCTSARPDKGDDDVADVDFAIGACQVFRRAAFDAVDGLDDSAAFGPEDVDFCLRVRARVSRGAGRACAVRPPAATSVSRASRRRAGSATAGPSSAISGATSAAVRRRWSRERRLDVVIVAYAIADVSVDVVRRAGVSPESARSWSSTTATTARPRSRAAHGARVVEDPDQPGVRAGQNHGVA